MLRRLRGKYPEFDPFFEIARKKEFLDNLQPRLRTYFSNFASEVTSVSIFSLLGNTQ
jgi:hypothetical protein